MGNFTAGSIDITNLIDEIKQSDLQIPNFQRDFVWSPNQIKALLDSIRKGIPLGAIITWEVPNPYTVHFEQYLSEEAQQQGGWLVLDQAKMATMLWQLDDIKYKKSHKKAAIPRTKTKDFEGIIDGRQRTQSLLFAFGGMCYGYKSNRHAKVWYLDLNIDISGDANPFNFVKVDDVLNTGGTGKLNSLSKWIDAGWYPLWWTNQSDYTVEMSKGVHYSTGSLPANYANRVANISKWTALLASTKLAKIELNKSVDLSQVCEVFETLNEAGTKVSAFDIVHATLIGQSNGNVDLKARLDSYRNENLNGKNPGLVAWTKKEQNWKNFAQGVTLSYCLSSDIQSKFHASSAISSSIFTSVKGDAMIATPPEFYAELLDLDISTGKDVAGYPSHSLLEKICLDFHSVTRGNGGPSTRWCPSPILFSFYLALRLKLHYAPTPVYSLNSLNDSFRAYYWRAISTSLYDQGYLTMIYAHTKGVGEFLGKNESDYTSNPNRWWKNFEKTIESFTTAVEAPDQSQLEDWLKDTNPRGTVRHMLNQSLFMFGATDIKSGNQIYKPDVDDVELHHIFPQNWITNNISSKDLKEKKKCVSVLVPMLKKPNNEWKAKDPKVALNKWHSGNKVTLRPFYDSLGIPTHSDICHDCLNDDAIPSEDRLQDFINERAKYLAKKIVQLSECQPLTGFPAF